MKQKEVAYSIVDVFTDTRFRGNPLAVIHDGQTLSSEEMQSITREFGFSETSFILPPLNAGSTAQVRIFTPSEEVPFAGAPQYWHGVYCRNQANCCKLGWRRRA